MRPLDLAVRHGDGERPGDVGAELYRDADSHHQVDEGDPVELDIPEVHETHHVDEDHGDDPDDDDGGDEIEGEEEEADDEDGREGDAEHEERVVPHGQVLLVVHVEDGVGEDADLLLFGAVGVDLKSHKSVYDFFPNI